ncbi:MAG: hypothetical protein LH473_10080 [Chitinophagales bacterium]|nr:hypothetical protein [Chitinophagales bacterium]
MKLLVDVKDSKADFVVELLESLPFTKTKLLSASKAKLLSEMNEAIVNLNLAKAGKLKAKPLKQLLDEI